MVHKYGPGDTMGDHEHYWACIRHDHRFHYKGILIPSTYARLFGLCVTVHVRMVQLSLLLFNKGSGYCS
jgi:hypothetical protein